MHVTFLLQNLVFGGTQQQVVVLAKALAKRGHRVSVLTFYPGLELGDELGHAGVEVTSLEKRGRWDLVAFAIRLVRAIRRARPDILYSFLPVPNTVASLASPWFPSARLVWGLRATELDLARYDWLIRLSYRVEALLSRFADLAIANSHTGRDEALASGFPEERLTVIPNGVDVDRFRPDAAARSALRDEFAIPDEAPLIGAIGRWDPQKDYRTFVEAAARLVARLPEARFLLCGKDLVWDNAELAGWIDELGLRERFTLAGNRRDVERVTAAFDVAGTSSAFGEGFSNAVAEAMACAVPCVVTDVGDAALIVGDTGVVVPIGEPEALAAGWRELLGRLEHDGPNLGAAARARVVENFGQEKLAEDTETALLSLLEAPPPGDTRPGK